MNINVTIPNNVTKSAFFFKYYNSWWLLKFESDFKKCKSIPNSVIKFCYNIFSECSSLKNIIISNSVTIIPICAFEECSSLSNVIIPSSVMIIGEKAFSGCSIKNIIIPNDAAKIAPGAFPVDCKVNKI